MALELYYDKFHEPSVEKKMDGFPPEADFRAAKLIIVTDSADLVEIFNNKVWKWIKVWQSWSKVSQIGEFQEPCTLRTYISV